MYAINIFFYFVTMQSTSFQIINWEKNLQAPTPFNNINTEGWV